MTVTPRFTPIKIGSVSAALLLPVFGSAVPGGAATVAVLTKLPRAALARVVLAMYHVVGYRYPAFIDRLWSQFMGGSPEICGTSDILHRTLIGIDRGEK